MAVFCLLPQVQSKSWCVHVEGKNRAPYILIPTPNEYVVLHGKGELVAILDVLEVILDYTHGTSVITWDLINEGEPIAWEGFIQPDLDGL